MENDKKKMCILFSSGGTSTLIIIIVLILSLILYNNTPTPHPNIRALWAISIPTLILDILIIILLLIGTTKFKIIQFIVFSGVVLILNIVILW